jgi:cell wall-associated NlpC family hydrolase
MFLATSHPVSRSSRVAPEPELTTRPSTGKSATNISTIVAAPTPQQQTNAGHHNALQSTNDSAISSSSRTVDLVATRLPQAGNTVLVVAPAATLPTTVVIPLSLPVSTTSEVKAAPPAPLAIRLPVSLTPKETDSDAGDSEDEENDYSDSDLKAPQVSRAALKAAGAPVRGALAEEIASSAAMDAYTEGQVVEYARKNNATSKVRVISDLRSSL